MFYIKLVILYGSDKTYDENDSSKQKISYANSIFCTDTI